MAKEMNKWLQFSKIGTPILDRFVCFKVPFKEEINRNLPPEKRFYLDDLFEQYPSLGMVVDLTKTTRYYDSKIITARNIKYEKIFMAGQGSLPKRNQIEKFFRLIDEFLDSQKLKNSNDFIGVHCTHGLNRTGYMVCKYMIERMNVNPDEAISAFESGRGHKIERKTYIHDLRGLPKVPVVPKRMKQSKKGKIYR
jgi:atypical dual specificity phosphatase